MQRSVEVWARWQFIGFHRWADAQGEREYLASRHRHVFQCEARIAVYHDDREVEFHDLQDVCIATLSEVPVDGASCEQMAARVIDALMVRWPERPAYTVTVSEDGECGATMRYANVEMFHVEQRPVSKVGPHSRACGITPHEHGPACHTNCPTCGGAR